MIGCYKTFSYRSVRYRMLQKPRGGAKQTGCGRKQEIQTVTKWKRKNKQVLVGMRCGHGERAVAGCDQSHAQRSGVLLPTCLAGEYSGSISSSWPAISFLLVLHYRGLLHLVVLHQTIFPTLLSWWVCVLCRALSYFFQHFINTLLMWMHSCSY